MPQETLLTYLHDHLAGARVTLEILDYLQAHATDPRLRGAAASFTPEVEADRDQVEALIRQLGGSGVVREATLWLGEKLSRLRSTMGGKSSRLAELEAVEVLALCFMGKTAMWDALQTVSSEDSSLPRLDYDGLRNRAHAQARRMETHRIRLVRELLQGRTLAARQPASIAG